MSGQTDAIHNKWSPGEGLMRTGNEEGGEGLCQLLGQMVHVEKGDQQCKFMFWISRYGHMWSQIGDTGRD